jgi:hypothetical protein
VEAITGGDDFVLLRDNYHVAEVSIAAINVLFSDHQKCLDLIFIYLSGLMISIGNLRFLWNALTENK